MSYALIWLAVTIAAVVVAAAAVGSVRDQVTDAPAAMVPSTTTTTSLDGPTVQATDSGLQATTTTAAATATSTPPGAVGSTTTVPNMSTATTTPAPPTTVPPAPSPTTTAARPTTEIRSYDLIGGSVTVELGPGTVRLAGASPKAGFGMEVENPGPEKVEVEFRSEDHESQFSARFEDGVFVPRIDEEGHEEDD